MNKYTKEFDKMVYQVLIKLKSGVDWSSFQPNSGDTERCAALEYSEVLEHIEKEKFVFIDNNGSGRMENGLYFAAGNATLTRKGLEFMDEYKQRHWKTFKTFFKSYLPVLISLLLFAITMWTVLC